MRRYFLFMLLFTSQMAQAQKPPMLTTYKEYLQSVKHTPEKQMVELKQVVNAVVYDLKYATRDNFMQRRMYARGTNITFLRKNAALALAGVQQELNQKGYGIKVFDAYRPWSVSKSFWDLVQDERYVANPSRGSNHNRGTAVDLTIIELSTGRELDMGTGFDNFTDTAHHPFKNLPPQVLHNRELLKTVMQKHGFEPYTEEWWHYTYKSPATFEVLNIPFKKLAKFRTKRDG